MPRFCPFTGRKVLLFWGLLGAILQTYGQARVVGLPIQWSQYGQQIPQINPAYTAKDARFALGVGNMSHLGPWSNNGNYYGQLETQLGGNGKSDKQFHALGSYLTGDKEGAFLSRTRGYLTYAYNLELREELRLAAGLSFGFANILVSSNAFNAGGVANAPDANLGVCLYNKGFHLGISSNQLLNSQLKPIGEVTVLQRHWNIIGSKTFVLSPNFKLEPFVLARVVPNQLSSFDIGTSGVLGNAIRLTVNYQQLQSVACIVGLDKVSFGGSELKAAFSYKFPLSSNHLGNIQTIEITLGYLWFGKRNKEQENQITEEDE